jgi:sugar lactone lactonase YvrE
VYLHLLTSRHWQFPNEQWNSYGLNTTANAANSFVSVDGARIGPDGRYWVVDGGDGGKLVGVNLTTNEVDKNYNISQITTASGVNIDDVRFGPSGEVAYLSDTSGALIVLNSKDL